MNNDLRMELAGIEYLGCAGVSQESRDGVIKLLQFGDIITHAKILSCNTTHAFLLTINVGDRIAIKSGFSSGYGGEGPCAFSYIIQLLYSYGIEIKEYDVPSEMMERLDNSALTIEDIKFLDGTLCIIPTRWSQYIIDNEWDLMRTGQLWREFPIVLPFSIIDSRIADLAIDFNNNPDEKLITGYRRLEDIIRRKSGINEHGQKLFSQAFRSGPLSWNDIEGSELEGRINLFTGVYMAYRNPRAHQELNNHNNGQLLSEFLLLNHLYILEADSVLNDKNKK